jgi:hypothetical protein
VPVKQQRENTDKHKTKKNKFWLKMQIAKNQSKESHNGNKKQKQRLSRLSKNHKKKIIFIFCQLLTEQK